jgi:hypothetical protein
MTRFRARWGAFVSVETVWTATGLERQVFLDGSGRRRRSVGVLGALLAVLAAVWMMGLVTGSIGFSNMPALRAVTAVRPSTHRAHAVDRDPRHHSFNVADSGAARRASGRVTVRAALE